ncbi:hypothetical protein P1312_030 [Thermobifida phage P1312]|nr:hypothetical protein P1312_030 [Thermobifida phage P1312]
MSPGEFAALVLLGDAEGGLPVRLVGRRGAGAHAGERVVDAWVGVVDEVSGAQEAFQAVPHDNRVGPAPPGAGPLRSGGDLITGRVRVRRGRTGRTPPGPSRRRRGRPTSSGRVGCR